jgi:hypothetical protein
MVKRWLDEVEERTVVRVWCLVMKDWREKVELFQAERMSSQEPDAGMK